jgi:cobalt-zinc-cadmium efflux system protein
MAPMAGPDHHSHPHSHHHEHEHGSQGGQTGTALWRAAALTLAFALVEGAGGWWTGSLALLSDAGHMLTDGAALALAALAAWIARRPPSQRHSYGLGRAEIFAATLNSAAMLAIVGVLVYESIVRLKQPVPVNGAAAAGIAFVGLVLNIAVLRWLAPHGHDLNARGARLHVMGDVLGSIAALASGAVIAFTGWTLADPIASLVICVLIGFSAVRLLREGVHALMEGVPHGLSVETVGHEMANVEGVVSVHDLHVWMLSGSRTALSAHVVVANIGQWHKTLQALQVRLHERFGIDHVTLQPETAHRPIVFRK